jgi:hypothetical protein
MNTFFSASWKFNDLNSQFCEWENLEERLGKCFRLNIYGSHSLTSLKEFLNLNFLKKFNKFNKNNLWIFLIKIDPKTHNEMHRTKIKTQCDHISQKYTMTAHKCS